MTTARQHTVLHTSNGERGGWWKSVGC